MNNSTNKTLVLASHSRLSPQKARRDFERRASLLFGELFMELVAYADESGIHDQTGVAPGSREMTVGGIVAPREDWSRFCAEWQKALNKYGAPYFHFWEWTIASEVARKVRKPTGSFQKNPYRHLTPEQLNSFVIEMAKIAGSGNKLIVGMGTHTSLFHKQITEGKRPQTETNVQLTHDNYGVIKAGAKGVSRGFELFGVIPFASPNYGDAKAALYKSVHEPLTGKAVALANQTEDRSTMYLILFSIPKVTITADVVEFTDKQQSTPP